MKLSRTDPTRSNREPAKPNRAAIVFAAIAPLAISGLASGCNPSGYTEMKATTQAKMAAPVKALETTPQTKKTTVRVGDVLKDQDPDPSFPLMSNVHLRVSKIDTDGVEFVLSSSPSGSASDVMLQVAFGNTLNMAVTFSEIAPRIQLSVERGPESGTAIVGATFLPDGYTEMKLTAPAKMAAPVRALPTGYTEMKKLGKDAMGAPASLGESQ